MNSRTVTNNTQSMCYSLLLLKQHQFYTDDIVLISQKQMQFKPTTTRTTTRKITRIIIMILQHVYIVQTICCYIFITGCSNDIKADLAF